MSKDWIGSTSGLVSAAGELNKAYQGILHEQVDQSAKSQTVVVDRLRRFEKEVGATSQQICKQVSQADTKPILESSIAIENLLCNIHTNIKECMGMAKTLDQRLPVSQRSSASGFPPRAEFPNLYDYAVQTTTPELIQLSRAKATPQASVAVTTDVTDDL